MADKSLAKKDKRYHENFIKRIINSILVIFLIGMSYLPFWILFGISDIIFIPMRYIFRYRHKAITENITNSFPDKNEKEILRIKNRFYHHLCDMFVETIKAYSISENEMKRRMKLNNIDILDKYFEEKRSIIIMGMHFNNWEWNSILQKDTKHQLLVIYNPMRGNEAFENYLLKIRTRWGCDFVPVHKSRRIVFDIAKMEKPVALVLGADQTSLASSSLWTMFLNQETPFFTGPEKIAKYSNTPVFFHKAKKVKRGMYEIDFIPLLENPKDTKPNEIILKYIQEMEKIINEEPEFYLWSHRRWKHSRPEGTALT